MYELIEPKIKHEPARFGYEILRNCRQELFNDNLSSRELEILELTSEGLTDKAIGKRIYLGVETVKSHQKDLYRDIKATNRVHAVRLGIEIGYIGFEPEIDDVVKDSVSKRESTVLELFSLGFNTDEVASALGLSPNTIRSHRKHLFDKLETRSMTSAVRRAFEVGLFPFPARGQGVSALRVAALLLNREVDTTPILIAA